jgi:hypothetical protein
MSGLGSDGMGDGLTRPRHFGHKARFDPWVKMWLPIMPYGQNVDSYGQKGSSHHAEELPASAEWSELMVKIMMFPAAAARQRCGGGR